MVALVGAACVSPSASPWTTPARRRWRTTIRRARPLSFARVRRPSAPVLAAAATAWAVAEGPAVVEEDLEEHSQRLRCEAVLGVGRRLVVAMGQFASTA